MSNVEPHFNHLRKGITKINPNMIKIMAPYIFPLGSWLGIGGFTLEGDVVECHSDWYAFVSSKIVLKGNLVTTIEMFLSLQLVVRELIVHVELFHNYLVSNFMIVSQCQIHRNFGDSIMLYPWSLYYHSQLLTLVIITTPLATDKISMKSSMNTFMEQWQHTWMLYCSPSLVYHLWKRKKCRIFEVSSSR